MKNNDKKLTKEELANLVEYFKILIEIESSQENKND